MTVYLLAAVTPANAANLPDTGRDICDLLTAEEIERVQGDRLNHAKASAPERPQFEVEQCFFATESYDNSVSLEITRPLAEAPGGVTPRSFWKDAFHRPHDLDADSDSARARAAEKTPHPVPDLGDEAFWIGRGGPAGALYVLDGDLFVRLSVGGAGDGEEKLERTAELARLILERL